MMRVADSRSRWTMLQVIESMERHNTTLVRRGDEVAWAGEPDRPDWSSWEAWWDHNDRWPEVPIAVFRALVRRRWIAAATGGWDVTRKGRRALRARLGGPAYLSEYRFGVRHPDRPIVSRYRGRKIREAERARHAASETAQALAGAADDDVVEDSPAPPHWLRPRGVRGRRGYRRDRVAERREIIETIGA